MQQLAARVTFPLIVAPPPGQGGLVGFGDASMEVGKAEPADQQAQAQVSSLQAAGACCCLLSSSYMARLCVGNVCVGCARYLL